VGDFGASFGKVDAAVIDDGEEDDYSSPDVDDDMDEED
jgi:hypothetical protein